MTPLAYASSIIGIISFLFTLSIFFNTFAQAWDTVLGAPVQITDYLGNLREELYEEKEALKRARARPHGYRLKILDDSVKDILREFRRIERPFLPSGRRGSKRGRAKASASASGGEKGVAEEEEEDFKAKAPGFYVCDWRHRVIWLQTKSAAVRLATVLDRLQTRRIERELSDVHLYVPTFLCCLFLWLVMGAMRDKLILGVGLYRVSIGP